MAHLLEDRILETSTSTGVGAFALSAAVTGFRRFSAVYAVGDTLAYFIEAVDALGVPSGDYEYGIGTYSAANTLTRTLVKGSSNGGAAVNFAAGSKNVGVAALGSDLVPAGLVVMVSGTTVPNGYIKANGALLSRAAYPALWAWAQASGNIVASDAAWSGRTGAYSPGDGATNFRVPDLRGEFVRSWADDKAVDTGRVIGSNQSDDFKSHSHGQNVGNQTAAGSSGTASSNVVNAYSGGSTNASGGTETRPRNVALMFAIKA